MHHVLRALASLFTGGAAVSGLVMFVLVLYHGYVEDAGQTPTDLSREIALAASIAGVLTVLAGVCWYHAVRLRRAAAS